LLALGAQAHDRAMHPVTFNPRAEHPGGCYTCRYFGERIDVAVWCAMPGHGDVRSQAERGCAFWEHEPGADDDLATHELSRPCIAPALLWTR
jgi:hypothetical protein